MDKKIYSSEIERDIRSAVENFEIVLREQVARNQRMRAEREEKGAANKTGDPVPNSNRDKVIIGTAAGDGIGPEIMQASRRVWDAAVRAAYGDRRRIVWCDLPLGEAAAGQSSGTDLQAAP